MGPKEIIQSISRKVLFIILGILVAATILYMVWQNNKYKIVRNKLADTVAKQTDSLYKIKYDSLHFDEVKGEAYLKNVHIEPDTLIIKKTKLEDLPYIILDITIASIKVTGVKTDKALLGQQMIGDSVVIDRPDILVYFVKPLQKHTNINVEASNVYKQILGNLKRIQVSKIFINDIQGKGVGFFDKSKDFDVTGGNIQLSNVLVDSASNYDTSRTLFCRQAIVDMASFISYDNNRPELRISHLAYSGKGKALSFGDIAINRFESENSDSSRLLQAKNLSLIGLNTNEIVKSKNIIVDTITCPSITLYQPPAKNLRTSKKDKVKRQDSTGFRHVYSIDMKHLGFPKVHFVPGQKSNYTLGNISIKINEVKADEIIEVQNHPLDYSKEAQISCDRISMPSADGMYQYALQNASINSLQKQFNIGSVSIKPLLSEKAFANKAHFQKDRYDVVMKGLSLRNIDMNNLLDKKIFASDLIIKSTTAKIFRDLTKPLDGKSKLGNYPPQMLKRLSVPVNITHATLSNAFIQYTEHEQISDSSGIVTFEGSTIHISNITNIDAAIQKNNATTVSYVSKALGAIPIKGQFIFYLTGEGGDFAVKGHVSAFDTHILNKIAPPMALMRFNTGNINAVDFNFKGNNYGAHGDFVMKYDHLKVDVLKRDKDSREIKKKHLTSLAANIIIKNNNPENGNLRQKDPKFNRDIHKSFFNLVWKTIFTGMKQTVGLP